MIEQIVKTLAHLRVQPYTCAQLVGLTGYTPDTVRRQVATLAEFDFVVPVGTAIREGGSLKGSRGVLWGWKGRQ